MCNSPAKQSPQNQTASWVFHFRQNGHKVEMLKRVAIITNNGVRLQNRTMLTSKQTLVLFFKVFSKHAIRTFIYQTTPLPQKHHFDLFLQTQGTFCWISCPVIVQENPIRTLWTHMCVNGLCNNLNPFSDKRLIHLLCEHANRTVQKHT